MTFCRSCRTEQGGYTVLSLLLLVILFSPFYFTFLIEEAEIIRHDKCDAGSEGRAWHVLLLGLGIADISLVLCIVVCLGLCGCWTWYEENHRWITADSKLGQAYCMMYWFTFEYIVAFSAHALFFCIVVAVKAAAPVLTGCPGVHDRFSTAIWVTGTISVASFVLLLGFYIWKIYDEQYRPYHQVPSEQTVVSQTAPPVVQQMGPYVQVPVPQQQPAFIYAGTKPQQHHPHDHFM